MFVNHMNNKFRGYRVIEGAIEGGVDKAGEFTLIAVLGIVNNLDHVESIASHRQQNYDL